jgi:hypothetical protein
VSPPADLFSTRAEPWPQNNDAAEAELRTALLALRGSTIEHARNELAGLEARHGERRRWVWAKLGHAPLAAALEWLSVLAEAIGTPVPDTSVEDAVTMYTKSGWQVDDAFIRAIGMVERAEDLDAVRGAASAIYRSWAEAAANTMTKLLSLRAPPRASGTAIPPGTCLVFIDGLRYDLGCRLQRELETRGCDVETIGQLAAVPTVTATAKPAISPVAHLLAAGEGLGTIVAATGAVVTAEGLRKLMATEGIQTLRNADTGNPSGRAWSEVGDIDARGHQFGLQLARHVEGDLDMIADRVMWLLRAGWRRVELITDHGWLLEPDALDKVAPDLPDHLTDVRKGRCARLKATAPATMPEVPWTWDPSVRIAVAPGIRAFVQGKQYEHGGTSPQECVVPRLVVSLSTTALAKVSIESVRWVGLRCRVSAPDASSGTLADIRCRPIIASGGR